MSAFTSRGYVEDVQLLSEICVARQRWLRAALTDDAKHTYHFFFIRTGVLITLSVWLP